jgi:hypothetical protein
MKALSIKQPWAWAICNAGKDIENRNWHTHYRGSVLIHAGKTVDNYGYEFLKSKGITPPDRNEILKGGIVGHAEIIDCVISSPSPWFFGKYGFVLINQKPIEFIPYKGKLNFFNVENVHE